MRRQKLQKQRNKENRAAQKRRTKRRERSRLMGTVERAEESDRVQTEWSTQTSCSLTDSEVSNRNVSWADDHVQPSPCFPALLLL